MEPLFKNKTILSKKNYNNLVKFHQKKNNWKYWLYTAIFFILLIVLISFHIVNHNYLFTIILFCFLFFFLIYRFLYPYYKIGKEFKSNKIQNNLVNYYFFYDKFFKVKNQLGSSKIKYHKLHRVYENGNYFYLYLDDTNAFIIDKCGFTIGDSETFKKFIKNKVWFKFK